MILKTFIVIYIASKIAGVMGPMDDLDLDQCEDYVENLTQYCDPADKVKCTSYRLVCEDHAKAPQLAKEYQYEPVLGPDELNAAVSQ